MTKIKQTSSRKQSAECPPRGKEKKKKKKKKKRGEGRREEGRGEEGRRGNTPTFT